MKKNLFVFAVALATLLVSSCGKKEEPKAEDSISVTPAAVEADYKAQEVTVNVKSNGSWTVEGYSKWVKTETYEGKGDAEVTFNLAKNESGQDRSYTYTFVCGEKSTEVVIKQTKEPELPPEDMIELDKDQFNAEGTEGECSVTVTSTLPWTLTGGAAWVSTDKTKGENGDVVTFTYGKNTGSAVRSAKFVFSIGEKTAEFALSQAVFVPEPDKISVNPSTKNVTAPAGSFTATVTSTNNWTLSSSESWLTADKSSGANGASVTFSYTQNTTTSVRTAKVTFTCGTEKAELTVNQNPDSAKEPLDLQSGTTAKNVYLNTFDSGRTHCLGGSFTWKIKDNDQDWTATLTPAGKGATLTFDASAHEVKINVDAASEVTRKVECWTITVARPADTQPLVLCVYQQEYVKNSKPSLHAYEYSENTIAEGTYVIGSMDSNPRPFTLWNGISSSEARTYDLNCYLATGSAGEKNPACFWYPDFGRISAVRAENLFDIKAKGDGTYYIRPVGNTACGLGEVDGKLMIAAECVNSSWKITKGSYGWVLQCGSKYMTVSAGTPQSTAQKTYETGTQQKTLALGASANSSASNYIRLFKAAYADTHSGASDVNAKTPDTDVTVTAAGGNKTIEVYTTGSYTASSSASWCKVASSGTGVTASFAYSVDQNTSGAERSAVITLTSNGSSCKINVKQSK